MSSVREFSVTVKEECLTKVGEVERSDLRIERFGRSPAGKGLVRLSYFYKGRAFYASMNRLKEAGGLLVKKEGNHG